MPPDSPDIKINIREKAANIILLTERESAFSDVLLNNLISSSNIKSNDRKLLTRIVYGTLRNKMFIDSIIYKHTAKKKKVDSYVLNILRVSVYQLMFLQKVPDFAVINEAVEIVNRSKKPFLKGFVNAVLRSVARVKDGLLDEPPLTDPNEISRYFSFPLWLTKYLIDDIGTNDTVELFRYSNTPPKLVVKSTGDPRQLETALTAQGIRYEKLDFPKGSYTLTLDSSLSDMTAALQSGFIVQSAASSIIVDILAPREGDTVLDLCAAPGTKTVGIAKRIKSGGVIACDLHRHRLRKVKDNIDRYDIDNVSLLCCDAKAPLPFTKGFFADRILLDVPCTGLGIVRKTPEIKYKVTFDDVTRMEKLQYTILQNASKYLKTGGRLVYSTCTITREENGDVIKKFLDNNDDYVLEKIRDPDLVRLGMVDKNGFFKTIPHKHNTGGFFAAVLVRRA